MVHMLSLLVLLSSLGWAGAAMAMDIHFESRDSSAVKSYAVLSGSIESGDCAAFEAGLHKKFRDREPVNLLVLKSPGGSLLEGVCIGKLVRKFSLITLAPAKGEVPESDLCASACALVWLGGLRRLGTAYAHHPFVLDGSELDFEDYSEALGAARELIIAYVREMNLESGISETVLSASSATVVPLSAEDLGISYDPVFLEYVISGCGSGLSKDEMGILSFLRDMRAEGLRQDDIVYQYVFNLLEAAEKSWKACRDDRLLSLQVSAQLGNN